MDNVTPLRQHLEAHVGNCYSCPFAQMTALFLSTSEPEYRCTATVDQSRRPLVPHGESDPLPDFCPLRNVVVIVRLKVKDDET